MSESVISRALLRPKKTGGEASDVLRLAVIWLTSSCALACLRVKIFEAMRPLGGNARTEPVMSWGDSDFATWFGMTLRNLSPCGMTAMPLRFRRVSKASRASSRVMAAGNESV